MNILTKRLKVLSLSAIVAFSCTALPAWTQINHHNFGQDIRLIEKTDNKTVAIVYSRLSKSSKTQVNQDVIIHSSTSPQLNVPLADTETPVSNKAHTKNNIFEFAIIFNDKLQQFIAAFSRFLLSNAHAETVNHSSVEKFEPANNCKSPS